MEEAVEEVKQRVIHELIIAAGLLNSFGAPGVIVYIPCQIIGGLAIAHIYNPEYTVNRKYMLNVATVMIYGQLAGELVWSQLVQILNISFDSTCSGSSNDSLYASSDRDSTKQSASLFSSRIFKLNRRLTLKTAHKHLKQQIQNKLIQNLKQLIILKTLM